MFVSKTLLAVLFAINLAVTTEALTCYRKSGGPVEGSTSIELATGCASCSFQQLKRDGKVFRTDRSCSPYCRDTDDSTVTRTCCERDKCNFDLATATSSGQVSCYVGKNLPPQGKPNMPVKSNCNYCLYSELVQNGIVQCTDRTCAETCYPMQGEYRSIACCQADKCNYNKEETMKHPQY